MLPVQSLATITMRVPSMTTAAAARAKPVRRATVMMVIRVPQTAAILPWDVGTSPSRALLVTAGEIALSASVFPEAAWRYPM